MKKYHTRTADSVTMMNSPIRRRRILIPRVAAFVAMAVVIADLQPVIHAQIVPAGGIGSGMVLQRDKMVSIWGYGAVPQLPVSVTIGDQTFTSKEPATSGNGFFEVKVGPFGAGDHGDIHIHQDRGPETILSDVLFGDVFLCSGQSNMVFSMGQGFNDDEAIKEASDPAYDAIRLFTVTPSSSSVPINTRNSSGDALKIEQNWSHANSNTITDSKPFSYFSAVCWYTGRNIFNDLGRSVPIGLFTSAFGGTRVHQWSSADALSKCNQSSRGEWVDQTFAASTKSTGTDDSVHWNAMIYPILKMSFKGIFWLQGESDVNPNDPPDAMQPQRGGAYYACAIKAMVEDWRVKFQSGTGDSTSIPFMWVQLSPWVGHEAATSYYQLPAIRQAQLSVNNLDMTGFASAVDLGDPNPDTNPWGGVHFRTKGPVGDRLAGVAQALCYGNTSVQTSGPMAISATKVDKGLQIQFDAASLGSVGLVYKPMVCPFFNLSQPENIARCGWYEVLSPDANWTNTSATIDDGGKSITVEAPPSTTAVRYLYADWPVATLYNAAGLPATPFWLQVA